MIKKSKHLTLARKCILAASALLIVLFLGFKHPPSDGYIRERIVLLSSSQGSCSGQQIIAASGKEYILSAGHCRVLESAGSIAVTTEDGRTMFRRVIAEDSESDLLLIEAVPNLTGLPIAKSLSKRESIRTFTHGSGYDTYITKGVVIQNSKVVIVTGEAATCPKLNKFKIAEYQTFFGPVSVCTLDVEETVITAQIVPGSSGGAILNSEGELVGVASATNSNFGFSVRLVDIQDFLSNY